MKIKIFFIYMLLLFAPNLAIGEDALIIEIEIREHRFVPSEIRAPAGRKLKLIVHNTDSTIEEFESMDFHREKMVPAGGRVNIRLAPMRPGRYEFYGEFHQETAKGVLIIE